MSDTGQNPPLFQIPNRVFIIHIFTPKETEELDVNWLAFDDRTGQWGNFKLLDLGPKLRHRTWVWYEAQFDSFGAFLLFRMVKKSACHAGELGSIPGLERYPGEGNGTPVGKTHSSILAWRIHGQRSLAGYSPWGRKELDMTEQLILWLFRRYLWLLFWFVFKDFLFKRVLS